MKMYNYDVSKLDDTTYRIEDDIVRAFLLLGTSRALLIDSTNGSGDLLSLVRELTELPVTLVNTHADADHTGCNAQFPAALMHPAEYMYYAEMARPGFAGPEPVQDGELVELGSRTLEVILVPGHTPGSIALLDYNRRVLYSGDSVSSTPVFIFGRMRSLPALIVSLERLYARRGCFDVIHASHGELPLPPEQIRRQLGCARRLLAGELEPQEPPFDIPAKMYLHSGAGFFYDGGR